MVAGTNIRVDVWRMTEDTDDSVGGAVITGSVVYPGLRAAITPRRPTQAALEQGLEVDSIYDFISKQRGITLYERDEVEVVCPVAHPFYGLRFRIVGVQISRRHGRSGHQHATLSRIRESRSQQ